MLLRESKDDLDEGGEDSLLLPWAFSDRVGVDGDMLRQGGKVHACRNENVVIIFVV